MQHQDQDLSKLEEHDVVVEEAEAPEKKARTPQHVRNFYERMNVQLDEKGVWGKSPQAKAMKALMLREQVKAASFFGQALEHSGFGRLDRKRAVEKLVKEGKAVKQVSRNIRETAGTIHPATVDALLESLPAEAKESPDVLAATIGKLFGIRDYEVVARRTLRARRWMAHNPSRRVPMHVREGAVLSTAIAVAVATVFPEACGPEHLEAVRLLRAQYGETKENA